MADGERYIKVTESISDNISDVSKSLQEVSRLQTGLIKTFTDITKSSTATGQAWISVARFFSGTGFWRIQNKIKSISNLLQAAQKLEEKKEIAMAQQVDDLAKQEANYKKITEVLGKIKNLQDGELSYEETKLIYNNKYFKLLKMQLGTTGALMEFRRRLEKSQAKLVIAQNDEFIGNTRAYKQQLKQKAKLSDADRKRFFEFREMNKQQQTFIGKLFDLESRKEGQTAGRIGSYTKQQKKLLEEADKYGLNVEDTRVGGKGRFELDKLQFSRQDKVLGPGERITGSIGKFIEFFGGTKFAGGKFFGGSGVMKQKGGKIGGSTFAEFWDSFDKSTELVELTKFQNHKEIQKEKFRKLITRIGLFFSRGFLRGAIRRGFTKMMKMDWKRIGNTMLNVGKFVGKFLLLIPFILMFIFFLKKVGVIDLIKDIGATIFETLGALLFYGGKLIGTLLYFGGTIIEFFNAIFNGDMKQAWDALGQVLSAALDVLLVFGEFLLFGFIVPFFGGLLINIYDWIVEFFAGGKKDFFSVLGGILKAVIVIVTFVGVLSFLLPLLPGMFGAAIALGITSLITWGVTSIVTALGERASKFAGGAAGGALIGAKFGGVKGALIGGAIGGIGGLLFEKGGITNKRGPAIVGEKGPELLHLPAGARIQSNAVSRNQMGGSITNNFTIQVQGRIGATDSEIRMITDKISRQLQREINRTTSIR